MARKTNSPDAPVTARRKGETPPKPRGKAAAAAPAIPEAPKRGAKAAAAVPAVPEAPKRRAKAVAAAPVVPAGPAVPEPPKRRAKAVANSAAARAAPALAPWTDAEKVAAFSRFEAANPHPKSDLDYRDPFTLLVAVVLSAQATDAGVNKATARLFAEADTPAAMLALGEDRVRELIRTLGLYRNKAKAVIGLSEILVRDHGGAVPQDRETLQALPGVGRKTANVVLNVAFGAPTIAVDTHIFRVANRTGLAPGKTPDHVERALEAAVPERFKLNIHHWLILHGRYTCKAAKPACEGCIIRDICRWPEKA